VTFCASSFPTCRRAHAREYGGLRARAVGTRGASLASMTTPTNYEETIHLYTYRLLDGSFATYAGISEPAAFRRACAYHPNAVVGVETRTHECSCSDKVSKGAREGGWLICGRGECAGVIS